MIQYLFCLGLCMFPGVMLAQGDTATLNVEQVLEIVRQHHPTVKQANINIAKSDAGISIARGAFNPIISNIISGKTLSDTTYYDYLHPNITIPTWFGIEVTAGVENLTGDRLNPSQTVGQSSYIGVSIPLLKNLLMDKRRAYLQQSKVYNEMAFTEQQALVNTILMDAAVQYWEWVNAYQYFEIIDQNLTISRQRFELVKKAFQNGERPAIDTLEAMSQYQSFEFLKNESWLKFQNEGLALSVFLWQADNIPYQLPENITPQQGWDNEANMQMFTLDLAQLLDYARQFHPELQLYNQKLTILGIDQKLKFQDLLPTLDFSYNHLSKGYNAFASDGLLFQDNYQYGLKLEMPIPFSQGRGEYKMAKLRIEETVIAQSQKTVNIELKVRNYFNEYLTLKNQIQLQRDMLTNYENLLLAEEALFQNGESSLFLINSRENKVLENQRKLIELKTRYLKTIYGLQWSSGLLR